MWDTLLAGKIDRKSTLIAEVSTKSQAQKGMRKTSVWPPKKPYR